MGKRKPHSRFWLCLFKGERNANPAYIQRGIYRLGLKASTVFTARPALSARRASGSNVCIDKFGQFRFGHHANLGCLDFSFLEQHQGWNSTNAIGLRCFRIFIDIQFCKRESVSIYECNFIEYRSNHFAGPAPFRPIIDQHRPFGFQNFILEIIIGYRKDSIAHSFLHRVVLEVPPPPKLN